MKTIVFRPTGEEERIINAALLDGESSCDVIRRALRLLERDPWYIQARADAERLTGEQLFEHRDDW